MCSCLCEDGLARSLRQIWGDRPPGLVHSFTTLARVLHRSWHQRTLRAAAERWAERRPLALTLRSYRIARFLIVGQGSERIHLAAALRRAVLPGVLKGEALAQAYANMDVFVFPSETDTFGNVVLEASASGTPVVVTDKGGPKFLVDRGKTGFVAAGQEEFTRAVLTLYRNRPLRDRLGENARRFAEGRSWDSVFDQVYRRYACLLPGGHCDPETGRLSSARAHAAC